MSEQATKRVDLVITAYELKLVAITIPGSGGDGTTVKTLVGSIPWRFERVIDWRIIENGADFQYARNAAMASPAPTAVAGLALGVGRIEAERLFLRSKTGATIAAIFEARLADADTYWDTPVD